MAVSDPKLEVTHEFLQTYLRYVENTESPKIMHLWSAITSASACMGRHVHFPSGIGDLYPNMYVLLVGPPGTRKSTAMKYSCELVAKHTKVRFAPDDTGGQRQGLIGALEGDILEAGEANEFDILNSASMVADLTAIGDVHLNIQVVDAHQIYAWASEFGTFMGESNATMSRLLIKVWDGEDYVYKLKNTEQTLKDPLMTILGGTTTADIAKILPSEAIGQGFMSRFILVHAAKKEKRVARPSLDKSLYNYVADLFAWMSHEMSGAMSETQQAADMADRLYETEKLMIEDTRFLYYGERRQTHLRKLCMVLAAMRRSMVIEVVDVMQADNLLRHTEHFMPDALGEFGLSPVGAAKQKMLEFLQHAHGPVSNTILWQVMSRDMKRVDYRNSLADFINNGKIRELNTTQGQSFVYMDDMSDVWDYLVEGSNEKAKEECAT